MAEIKPARAWIVLKQRHAWLTKLHHFLAQSLCRDLAVTLIELDADGAAITVPADLPADAAERIRGLALQAFHALGCDGMARVDFFVRSDMSAVVNEINTIPGFTDISMYPKALAATGIAYPDLIDRVIQQGLARAKAAKTEVAV